jgi:4-amino-4-deoxy-L-arabinose transferase-like glycosyltransferase
MILAVGLKTWLVLADVVPFNSDEAVVALMARHILQGERPIFFYGQAYMGSLDAWLVAGGFALFGEHVDSIRIVQIILYITYLITLWLMLRRFFVDPNVANFAVLLASIPPVLLTTYTSATLGGYGETLVLGNLVLWVGYEAIFGNLQEKNWAWLLLGFLGGIGFWVLALIGIYLLTIAIVGLWKFSGKWLSYYFFGAVGFFIGSSLWWLYNLSHAWEAFDALFHSGLVDTTLLQRFIGFLVLGLPALLGLRFPWSPQFAPWPVLIVLLVFFQAVMAYLIWSYRKEVLSIKSGSQKILGTFGVVFAGVFIGTHFGIDSTGRYFMPLYVLLFSGCGAFLAAIWRRNKNLAIVVLILFLAVNGFETARAALSTDKITTQFDPITSFDNRYDDELISFLSRQGVLRGYSNYWVSFRLAFLSHEEIIYSPRLPYKIDLSYTKRDNRYPYYDQLVMDSKDIAYITTKHPELNACLRYLFDQQDMSWREAQIGPYHIFYRLSKAIHPEDLGVNGQTWQDVCIPGG